MKKAGALAFIFIFIAISLAPGAATLLWGESSAAANEVLSPKPMLKKADGSWNFSVVSDAADYFSDHFALRQQLITGDSMLKSSLFHSSANEKVALGKDGWLFYAETIDDYTGADLLSDSEALAVAENLRQAQDYAEQRGINFIFIIAPNKLSLYPEYGPDGLSPAAETSAQKVQRFLQEKQVNYLDLFSLFSSQEEVLYHKGDTHWNNKGASLVCDALALQLGIPGSSAFEKPGAYEETHKGDLFNMLYPASSQLEAQWEFAEELRFSYDAPINGPEDMRIRTGSEGSGGSLLMFRDSFGNSLYPLLAEKFSHAFFSRAVPFDLTLSDECDADVIVVEIVERNLHVLANSGFKLE